MSTAKRPRPNSRIREVVAAWVRVAFGPFSDRSRLDRNQAGPAGGVLVLVAVGLPVTLSSIWVIALSIVAGVIGAALIIKSLQRPRELPGPGLQDQGNQGPFPRHVQTDEEPSVQAASSRRISITDSARAKPGIDIPEGPQISVDRSELNESALSADAGHRMQVGRQKTTPVRAAGENEILLLVAQFDGGAKPDLKPEERIKLALDRELKRLTIPDIRVERLRHLIIEDGDAPKAVRVAAELDAAMIIWGWYDSYGFQPYFTIVPFSGRNGKTGVAKRAPWIGEGDGSPDTDLELPQPSLAEVMIDPGSDTFRKYMFTGLPEEMTYFATLTVGQLLYWAVLQSTSYGRPLQNVSLDAAESSFGRAIELGEALPTRPASLALAYFYRGFLRGTQRWETAAAAEDFRCATEIDPDFAQAFYNLGDALYVMEDFRSAIDAHTRALELDPDFVFALVERGDSFFQLGNYQEAVEDYTTALAANQWPRILIARSAAYAALGNELASLKDIRQAQEIDPAVVTDESILQRFLKGGLGKEGARDGSTGYYAAAMRILHRPMSRSASGAVEITDAAGIELGRLIADLVFVTGAHTLYADRPSETPFSGRSAVEVQQLIGMLAYDYTELQELRPIIHELSVGPVPVSARLKALLDHPAIQEKLRAAGIDASYNIAHRLVSPGDPPVQDQPDAETLKLAQALTQFRRSETERPHNQDLSYAYSVVLNWLEDAHAHEADRADYTLPVDGLQRLKYEGPEVWQALRSVTTQPIFRRQLSQNAIMILDLLDTADPSYTLALQILGKPPLEPSMPTDDITLVPEAEELAILLTMFRRACDQDAKLKDSIDVTNLLLNLWHIRGSHHGHKDRIANIRRQGGARARDALNELMRHPTIVKQWGQL